MSFADDLVAMAEDDRQIARLETNIAWLATHDLPAELSAVRAATQARLTEIERRMSTQLDALIAQADANEQQEETIIVGLRSDKAALQTQLDASQAALTALQNAGGTPAQIAAMQALVDRENALLAAAQAAAPAPPGSVQVVDTTGGAVTTTTETAAPSGQAPSDQPPSG